MYFYKSGGELFFAVEQPASYTITDDIERFCVDTMQHTGAMALSLECNRDVFLLLNELTQSNSAAIVIKTTTPHLDTNVVTSIEMASSDFDTLRQPKLNETVIIPEDEANHELLVLRWTNEKNALQLLNAINSNRPITVIITPPDCATHSNRCNEVIRIQRSSPDVYGCAQSNLNELVITPENATSRESFFRMMLKQ